MSSKNRRRSSSDASDSSREARKKSNKHDSTEKSRDRNRRKTSRERSSSDDRARHRSNDKNRKSRSRSDDRRRKSRSRSNERNRARRDSSRSREYKRDSNDKSRSRFDDRDRNSREDNRRDNYRRNDNRRRRSGSRSFDHANAKWGKADDQSHGKKKDEDNKARPNFGLSGKLTEETNTFKGVVIKYSEPPEARKPRRRWRLYPFKGEKALQTLYIHRESGYLIGRDRQVVDLAVDHPSCSKQHAALQYRLVPFTRENGTDGKRVRPYLIDLDSANGTFINNKKIDPRKYVELLERDVIKFGFSSREYVLLHENSKDEAMDDDVKPEDEEVKDKVKDEVD